MTMSLTMPSPLVMSGGLTPVETGGPRSVDGATDVEPAALLPDPMQSILASGDPGAELAMMVLASAKEDKKIGRSIRQAEERAQEAAEAKQLEEMREKAEAGYTAGLIGGFSTAGSGLVSVAGAGAAANASIKDAKAANEAIALRGENAKAPSTASSVETAWSGGAKVTEGLGKACSSYYQHEADEADTEATHQEQIAGRHKRAAEDARGSVDDAKELIDRAISFYKEYVTAKSDAQRAAFLRA